MSRAGAGAGTRAGTRAGARAGARPPRPRQQPAFSFASSRLRVSQPGCSVRNRSIPAVLVLVLIFMLMLVIVPGQHSGPPRPL